MTAAVGNEHGHPPSLAKVHIEVLHVPNCARLNHARALIDRALAATRITATVEETAGDFPSPTVRVDGADVTGRRFEPGAACRLDLPTDAQLRAALTDAAQRLGSSA